IEDFRGTLHSSYIWGRSVHNMRIECLWVDVTAQVGAMWSDYFTTLELRYGLDINNPNHIWLLHHLFLGALNEILTFFAESWNEHHIQIRGGPNRSPADMFSFDQLVHGVRGDQLPHDDEMTEDDLEVLGIDWEALRDERLLTSQQHNNDIREGSTSWLGRVGPPDNLNEVQVNTPNAPLHLEEIQQIDEATLAWRHIGDENSVILSWIHGLATA
ncbi:hypothetical protein L208DRAFT_1056934, partial [Tricholoma matsutake]